MRLRSVPWALAFLLVVAASAAAHPAPFSYLDLHLDAGAISGTLVVHDLDAAHDLGIQNADTLLEPAIAAQHRDALVALLGPRINLLFDGQPAVITWGAIDVVPDRQSVRLAFSVTPAGPGRIDVHAYVFPYDPIHQTFINIYEESALKMQAILDASHQEMSYYAGSTQGRWAVIKTFVLSGIEHIMIGPDHILFLIGLLLLGGTLPRLAFIVTSFTIGHSITLSLAALDILSPSARFIEPLIALTIVVVGADNLLVLRTRRNASAPSTSALRATADKSAALDKSAPSAALDRSASSAALDKAAPSAALDKSASSAALDKSASSAALDKSASSAALDKSAPSAALENSAPSAALEHSAADIRAWLAVAFGLIHGFGFAYVLKEFGLPQAALGWSLFAFNLGVEIGQLVIVAAVAGTLALVRRRSAAAFRQLAMIGSVAVIAAGTYWFVQRVFFT